MKLYSKPYYIKMFNHRVKKYIIDNDINCLGFFYRKQTDYIDKMQKNIFVN